MDSLRLLQGEEIELIAPATAPGSPTRPRSWPNTSSTARCASAACSPRSERGERSRAALLAEAWDDIPVELLPMAAMAMEAHLEKLEGEGRLPGDLARRSAVRPRPAVWPAGQTDTQTVVERSKANERRGRDCWPGRPAPALAAAGTAAAWHWLARRPLPKQRGTIELDGLEGRVRVRRDRWGVPHIEADADRRPLLRPGLLPRAGPALADGLLPPRRRGPGLRDGRRRRACRSTA